MGIRLLQSFIFANKHSGIFEEIIIKKEIENYKKANNGQRPVIVIDITSLLSHIFISKREMLQGGRYSIYNIRLEKILKYLISYDAEIVCILDGSIFEDKINTIIKRKNERYIEECEILQKIKDGFDLTKPNLNVKIKSLGVFHYNLRLIASKYLELIISTREGDQEIVFQANKKKALAIIAHDSDFLIFDGDWQLWGGTQLNLNKGTILRFNKEILRSELQLESPQMILFATLCGNDFVQYDMIEEFQKKLYHDNPLNKFKEIADIVRPIDCSELPNLREADEENIINLMFSAKDKLIGQQDFKKSIRFYCDVKEEVQYSSALLKKASNSHFLYSILSNIPYFISLFFYDLTETDDVLTKIPYYNLVRPMLKRQIGTILKSYGKFSKNEKRTFISKLTHDESYERIDETPVYPDDDLPTLEEFILTSTNKNTNLYKLKIKLFCWHILPDCRYFTIDAISNLPDELVLTVSTIAFLFEQHQITLDEADIILFACVGYSTLRRRNSIQNIISPGHATVAFLFTRLYVELEHSVQVLGLNNFESLLKFDGLYYHYLINNLDKEEKLLLELRREFQHLRIYAK